MVEKYRTRWGGVGYGVLGCVTSRLRPGQVSAPPPPRVLRAPSPPLPDGTGDVGASAPCGDTSRRAAPETDGRGSAHSHLFLPGKSSPRPRKSSNGPRGTGAPGREGGDAVPGSAAGARAHQLGAQPGQGGPDVRAAPRVPRRLGLRLRPCLRPRAPGAPARHGPRPDARLPPPEVFQPRAGGVGLAPPGGSRSCCPRGSRARDGGPGATARHCLGHPGVGGPLPVRGGGSPRGPSRRRRLPFQARTLTVAFQERVRAGEGGRYRGNRPDRWDPCQVGRRWGQPLGRRSTPPSLVSGLLPILRNNRRRGPP